MTAVQNITTLAATALQARRMFAKAVERQDKSTATHRLVREYLPALRVLADQLTTEQLDTEILTLDRRLAGGFTYEGEGAEKWFVLLTRYEVLCDCRNLEYQGTPQHPARYLAERIQHRCQH